MGVIFPTAQMLIMKNTFLSRLSAALATRGRSPLPLLLRCPARRGVVGLLALAATLAAGTGQAQALSTQVVGGETSYTVQPGDTLGLIGSHFGVERDNLARQTHTDPDFKVAHIWVGEQLTFSNRHIVPNVQRNGLLLNIAQRMLYLFRDGRLVAAHPIAVGVPDWQTPLGAFHVVSKAANPTWHVPHNIQEEMRNEGQVVRASVPPGPDNPLGKYWLGLSLHHIGIHGTISPTSIYRYESHGCVRLFPNDIESLFHQVRAGEPGRIVYMPVQLARTADGHIYLEVDEDVYNRGPRDPFAYAAGLIHEYGLDNQVDWNRVRQVVQLQPATAEDITASATTAPAVVTPAF